jgi:hypothetical protein
LIDNQKNYMDLIIDTKEGIVHDIYECHIFMNLNSGFEKKEQIKIDRDDFVFSSPS